MTTELAVMSRVRVGMEDHGVGLMFTVTLADGSKADQYLRGEEMIRFIERSNTSDVTNLNGRACLVERGDGLVHALEPRP